MAVTLFLGGWSVPWLSQETLIAFVSPVMGEGFATGLCVIVHFLTFMAKVVVMIWVQMTLRWTLPRFRYDQLQKLGWQVLLPLSLLNIFVTSAVVVALS